MIRKKFKVKLSEMNMSEDLPIIIDNGSYQCRAGFAKDETPRIVFRNHVARLRKDKGKKSLEIQVGNDIDNIDNVRFALRSQFDRNAVIHMDIQENIFDYIFASLNIPLEHHIQHPIALTEAFLNPNYCRHLMSELLFEKYQIPSVAYGLDCLYSLLKNFPDTQTQEALIISFGYKTIHVIPFFNGRVHPDKTRRINIGGFEITFFLHKLLHLKYPSHGNTLTLSKIEEILHSKGSIAESYFDELDKWTNMDYYNENVLKIQAPKKQQSCNVSQAQIETTKERRKEIAKKLTEINARRRDEKLFEDQERLVILNEIKDSIEEEDDASEVKRALQAAGVSTLNELLKQISSIKSRINKVKEKINPQVINTGDPSNSKQHKLSPDITEAREKRTEILKKRSLRRQRRSEMVKRRSFASQERMKILSQLAKYEKHDTFDSFNDWDIYKTIQKDGKGSDSEDEQEELNEVEDILRVHDPAFALELQQQEQISQDDEHELHIGLERLRAPELIFQPSMIGESQTGLAETIDHVLNLYPENRQTQLVSRVFLTGGCAEYTGLLSRLQKELMEIRPFESTFDIQLASNPSLDAWKGMSSWAGEVCNQANSFILKSEYEEKGGEYLKEQSRSNIYFPSPHQNLSMVERGCEG